MPLPKIKTRLKLSDLDVDEEEQTWILRPRYLPPPVVELIISWYLEFEKVRVKAYHYERFMRNYATSLFKSNSRLMLYNRELKALGMKYRTLNEPPTFKTFVQDARRCKRNYDYCKLKGIFF